ncbi:MAG TPA: hypothetical protein VGI16_02160 [Candidatus Acidoferrum sp.]
MGWIRSFSSELDGGRGERTLEDAPGPMRQELVDFFFGLAEHHHDEIPPEHVYRVICQSMGISSSGSPYSGYRYAAGRDVNKVDWQRIYDLISRLWPDFERQGFGTRFREGVNRILAAHSTAWELDENGRFYRLLPLSAQAQVAEAFAELNVERYQPAFVLFNTARDAFDDRPRRDRDACCNMFDAMESVAKEKFQLPDATFGQVMVNVHQANTMNPQILALLRSVNDLRNKNFGHGMTILFSLSGPEVDFAYLTCVAAILLLTRMP